MRADPIGEVLVKMSFDVGVTAGAQHGHEDLGGLHFTGVRVDERNGLTRVVDEQSFPSHMVLPHGRLQVPRPLAVVRAKLTVAVAGRLGFAILDPQQTQRHALAPQFGVQLGPVRLGDRSPHRRHRRGKQACDQRFLGQVHAGGFRAQRAPGSA